MDSGFASRPGMTGVGRVSAPNRAISRAHPLSHLPAHTAHPSTNAAHAPHTTRMGALQENRPQLQLRRPAGREALHNTSAAAALVVRDAPVVSRVPRVPRFTAVPEFAPNMADTVGALRRVGRNSKAGRGGLFVPEVSSAGSRGEPVNP